MSLQTWHYTWWHLSLAQSAQDTADIQQYSADRKSMALAYRSIVSTVRTDIAINNIFSTLRSINSCTRYIQYWRVTPNEATTAGRTHNRRKTPTQWHNGIHRVSWIKRKFSQQQMVLGTERSISQSGLFQSARSVEQINDKNNYKNCNRNEIKWWTNKLSVTEELWNFSRWRASVCRQWSMSCQSGSDHLHSLACRLYFFGSFAAQS